MAQVTYLSNPTVTQDDAIRMAQARFFVIGGQGLGLKFIDSQPELVATEGMPSDIPELEGSTHGLFDNLTLQNVADWVNTTASSVSENPVTPRRLQNKWWRSVLPTEVFRINKPLIMKSGRYLVRNGWRDTGVSIDHWRGRSAEEITEAAKYFTDLLTRCMGDDPERASFFIDWLRTCIQKPASKPPTVPYTYGPGGQFKGEIKKAIQEAFGEYTVKNVVKDSTLADKNAHESFRSALTVVEEVAASSHDGSVIYNAIKAYSTAARTYEDAKNAGQSYFDTPAGLWLQANHPCPFLEQTDRRMWIVKWAIPGLEDALDEEVGKQRALIYRELLAWKQAGGLAALRAYLELIPPTREFNDAPPTPEKWEALAMVFDPQASELQKRLNAPRLNGKVLFDHASIADLLGQMKPTRVPHLAREAGMVVTSADAVAKQVDPDIKEGRFRVGTDTAFRGSDKMYFREGWRLDKRRGVWKLVNNGGLELPLTAEHVSLELGEATL